jgi:hypothetical protein
MRYYSKAKREKAHENAVRRGIASGKARAAKRMEAGSINSEPRRRDPGEWIGELQWRDATGMVRRWPVKQARRKNQVVVAGKAKGWDWLLTTLRGHLAPLTR